MLSSIKRIHFIGIGGIGISGIAELLHNQDFIITGSKIDHTNKKTNAGIEHHNTK